MVASPPAPPPRTVERGRPPSGTERAQARVWGNRVNPRGQRGAPVKPGQSPPDLDEYVLGHVFCRLTVAKKAVRQPKNLASKGRQKQGDRLIAALRPHQLQDSGIGQHGVASPV